MESCLSYISKAYPSNFNALYRTALKAFLTIRIFKSVFKNMFLNLLLKNHNEQQYIDTSL